ncbi:hypothetical protein [Aquipuribacter sp. MA13-6]|uniref:hypothetical protein n=1 Tax=unclassified Aquipuribacter TaxID=2635084 RepID=UPI003EE95AE8
MAARVRTPWGEGRRLRLQLVGAATRLLESDPGAVTPRGVARGAGVTATGVVAGAYPWPPPDEHVDLVLAGLLDRAA